MQQEENVRDEKLDGDIQIQKSRFLSWLDNFWYHYKWHVIIGGFFAAVLLLGLFQFLDRPKYDVNFVVAGTYRMDSEQVEDYNKVLNQMLPEDFDGNGEKNVNIMAFQVYSDAELKEEISRAEAAAEAESEHFALDPQFSKYINDEMNNFTQYTMTGDCSAYLLTPHLYKSLVNENRLLPIAELYEGVELPEGVTEDGFGVYISQTHLYQYHPAMQVMPDDMILCFLRPLVWGSSSKEQNYANEKEFFTSLIDYQIKE